MLTEFEISAISLSLKVAFFAVTTSLPIAIFTAWLLARCHFRGKPLLNAILHLPLVLPPVVIGYLLLVSFSPQSGLGLWLKKYFNIDFSFSWQGAALASAIVAFPLMVRAISLSLETVDRKLEQAASTLGANRYKVFLTITLPLITPGILSGVILAFARSLGEFGATITFVSNIPEITRTIPLAMYSFIQTPGAEMQALRLCIIAVGIALIALITSHWLETKMRRKLTGN
ncbi:MAG: molybdate ABC transporter permease subunit [Oceanospirillaceae bacterium]